MVAHLLLIPDSFRVNLRISQLFVVIIATEDRVVGSFDFTARSRDDNHQIIGAIQIPGNFKAVN